MHLPSPAAARPAYVPGLDGLRCIAITLVVAAHTIPAMGLGIGVNIFFVISGFLITKVLSSELDRSGEIDLRRFYLRRILRLTPALVVMLACYSVVAAVAFPQTRGEHLWALFYSAAHLMNWARAFGWAPGDGRGLAHTWSLAMEEQFYLVWPLILAGAVRLMTRARAWMLPAALLGLSMAWYGHMSAAGASEDRLYNGFDTHAAPLLLGCTMALGPAWMRRLTVSAARPFLPLLEARPLVFIGQISFGIFLWHFPIAVFLNNRIGMGLSFPITALAAITLGALSFRFVEKPFMALRSRLTSRRRPVAAAASRDRHILLPTPNAQLPPAAQ